MKQMKIKTRNTWASEDIVSYYILLWGKKKKNLEPIAEVSIIENYTKKKILLLPEIIDAIVKIMKERK